MMTQGEMTRVRRQMQRRIRVVLAQRRLGASGVVRAPRPRTPPESAPDRSAESAEPAPED